VDLFLRIAGIITPVFLIVLAGWWYGRTRHPDMATFNRICLEVLTPALVFSALAAKDFDIRGQWPLMLAAVGMVAGSGLLSWPFARLLGVRPRALLPPMMFINSGNMGLPLALLALGPTGMAPAVAFFIVTNTLHFSLGVKILSREASVRVLLLSPLMIATALGLVFAFTRIPVSPWIMTGLKMLGDAAIPMLLFSLGVRLTHMSMRGWRIGMASAVLRPAIGIALAFPLMWLLPLDSVQRTLLFLYAALPPAVINYLFAEQYNAEPDKVASMVMIGNAMAVVFVPVGLWLGLRAG
jgi:predicted permease